MFNNISVCRYVCHFPYLTIASILWKVWSCFFGPDNSEFSCLKCNFKIRIKNKFLKRNFFRTSKACWLWDFFPPNMVRILDGNSEISAHVRSNHSYLICLENLITSRAVTHRIFFSPKTHFFPTCLRNIFWVTISYKYRARKYKTWDTTRLKPSKKNRRGWKNKNRKVSANNKQRQTKFEER